MSRPDSSSTSDIELVRQALEGSDTAYADLLGRFQRPVFSLIRRMVLDLALAEDLAQEAFLKAFRALDSFDQSRKFSSWLFKIAHNTTIDYLRKKQLDTVALESSDSDEPDLVAVIADSGAESPEERAHRRDMAGALELALASLRPAYREVIVLRFQEGLAYEEIAEITDLPLGTVKTHLHRGRNAMARHLSDQGWVPKGGRK
jgi:RNA polymerase sigma-70 factor (ECF subfamily)